MKLVIPDLPDLLEADKDRIRELGEVEIYDDIPDSEADVIQRIAGAELIAPSWVDITETVIQSNPNLKYIVVLAVGYDQVDVRAASAAGVKVINCPTHNASAVAEYTIGCIFAVTRKILLANQALKQGEWNPRPFQGVELRGKTLGLVGHGNTGREVEAMAIALGLTVHHATSKTTPAELDDLLATSDIVSLHLPLTPQSRHFIDERRLKLMKPSAYLINTARGAIVEPNALTRALKERWIAGAALDVFENEPVTGGPNPDIMELVNLDNVVATPHIAYNTEETIRRLGDELIENIRACLEGQPINVVN